MTATEPFYQSDVLYEGAETRLFIAYGALTGTKAVIKEATNTDRQITKEIAVLRRLQSQYIIRALAFDDQNKRVTLQFAEGGALLSQIEYGVPISEDLMKRTAYAILCALVQLHELGVVHNDVKPDNILVLNEEYTGDNVVLSDFGLASELDESGLSRDFLGTFEYAPPEKVCGIPYGTAADIWSLGVTIFTCLFAMLPFTDKDRIAKEITEGLPILDTDIMENISDEARDLLNNMLVKFPNMRISAADALNHPWFSDLDM